jgi:hypothetical protein
MAMAVMEDLIQAVEVSTLAITATMLMMGFVA